MQLNSDNSASAGPVMQARQFAGIFLLSLATLLLELSLTRVLSVALWYHFGFLIISTALLGFGASGVVLAVWTRLRTQVSLDLALGTLAALFSISTVFCFWLMQKIPFDPFNLLSDRMQLLFMPLYYVVIATPFFFSGLALALLLTRGNREINRLYAFDLVGAGVGCIVIVLVMPAFGGPGSVVVAAAIGLAGATVFLAKKSRTLALACAVVCAGAIGLAFAANQVLPIAVNPIKFTRPVAPIYEAWNTFSRIEVYERHSDFPELAQWERVMIFDGGTAATSLYEIKPDVREFLARHQDDRYFESGIAYLGKSQPKVLVIGSGAGAQVLDALHFGASRVTALEINPIINDLVGNRMRDFWGDLYNQPEVELVTEEGRSFVRRSRDRYDAIVSVHTISNAAVASGALALSENYVLTREAFSDYLDHLAPDGRIYFTRPEMHMPRLFATAREAMAELGISDISGHVYAYRLPPSEDDKARWGENQPAFVSGFVLQNTPLTREQVASIERLLGVGEPPRLADAPAPETLYSPFMEKPQELYRELVSTTDLAAVYRAQPREIAPATDDQPFFNHHTRWSSLNADMVLSLFGGVPTGALIIDDRPVTEITLLVLLAQTSLLAGMLILWPLSRFSREGLQVSERWRLLTYFAGLGLGFIMIEVALLGRFTLYLGQPVYSLAAILASLLIFTGVGSYMAGRLKWRPHVAVMRVIPAILGVLLATALATPWLFSATLGFDLAWRVTFAVLALAPLGILLGMPFPMGLRLISGEAEALVPWCWGVNGFFTVIGTVTATVLGMTFGFTTVLLCAALCYLAALASLATRRATPAI